MSNPHIIDVLIVGAGPAGSALAIDLTRRGLHVRLVDKASHAFDGSRAKGVQPRTLEVLHDLGALDDVVAGGSEYPLLGLHLGPVTMPWRMFRSREASTDVPFPNTWLIPQYRTDHALHARLSELGPTAEFGRELVEFGQDASTVTAKVSGPDGVEEITARYLVGADGGSSTVRKQLGIGFVGSTDDQDRILIIDAVTTGLSRDRWHLWPRPSGRFVGACPIPHSALFQWMVRLKPGEEPPVDESAIARRIQAHIRDRGVELGDFRWQSVFRPNIRLAEGYRRGRVFLAGDAAHVHTPAGAQGLNTGIQDAYNLGWKLAQVLAGADPALLDSYEAERLPIAARVLGISTQKYEGIAKLSPSSIRRGKDEQQLLLTYHGGPLAPGHGDRTKTLRVGDRAPDADLLRADGTRVRLFDLYRGPHFTAVGYGVSGVATLGLLDSPASGAPLERVAIDAGFHTTRSDEIQTLADNADSFRRAYGVRADTVLLIRPDGYLGHIATNDLLDSTRGVVRALTPPATIPGAGE